MVKVKKDLTGMIFGRLTVLEQTEDYIDLKSGIHLAQWLCKCSCEANKIVIVKGNNLKTGHTKSCGCLFRDTWSQIGKNSHKINRVDLSGEYGVGWTFNTNKEFYFDLEDYNKIKEYCWNETTVNGMSRLETKEPGTNKTIRMHILLGFKGYDHENRNELDNRKSNLRLCTKSQNQQNRSIDKRNTSGVTGVNLTKFNTWKAALVANGEIKLQKTFKTKEEAIRARLNAEAKYFGEFAPQKHLYEQYGINTPQND